MTLATRMPVVCFECLVDRSHQPGQRAPVMAITKCLIWVLSVNRFTVAVRALRQMWPQQRLDGPFAGLSGERS